MSERDEIPSGLAKQIDDMEIEIAYLSTRAEAAEKRAEKAESIIRGMFPMWINAMAYCEHGKHDQLMSMRNYYNGRDNPMTSEDIHLMFSLIPDKEDK